MAITTYDEATEVYGRGFFWKDIRKFYRNLKCLVWAVKFYCQYFQQNCFQSEINAFAWSNELEFLCYALVVVGQLKKLKYFDLQGNEHLEITGNSDFCLSLPKF